MTAFPVCRSIILPASIAVIFTITANGFVLYIGDHRQLVNDIDHHRDGRERGQKIFNGPRPAPEINPVFQETMEQETFERIDETDERRALRPNLSIWVLHKLVDHVVDGIFEMEQHFLSACP